MSWAPLLLVLSTVYSCSVAQYVVTQAPSVSVSPGQSVTLTCTKSSSSYEFHWHQQKPGSAPRFVWFGSSTRGPGIPDRFSGSTSGTVGKLMIANVQAEDDADYYCSVWDGSGNAYIFGGGTQLNVLTGETKLPALNVFPPSSEEVATGKATLVCTMHDFYPGSVTVTWKADGTTISSGVETTRPSKQSDNNLFMASSILSVPAVDWSGGRKYTCECTHQSKVIEKSVKHSECV